MDKIDLDRLVIGDNPFNGVDHLSQARSRSRKDLTIYDILDVVKMAFGCGATGFTFSTNPTSYTILTRLKEDEFCLRFGLYPVLPDAYSYSRKVSERGTLGLVSSVLGRIDTLTRTRTLVRGGIGLVSSNPFQLFKTFVSVEVSSFVKAAPKQSALKSVLLHEIVTDLIVSFGLDVLFREYCEFVSDSFGVFPGFVTRNFPKFTEFAKKSGVPLNSILVMTPFNAVGFQMNPSRADCEFALMNNPSINLIATTTTWLGWNLEMNS